MYKFNFFNKSYINAKLNIPIFYNFNSCKFFLEEFGFAIIDTCDYNIISNLLSDWTEINDALQKLDLKDPFISIGRLDNSAIRLMSTKSIEKNLKPFLNNFFNLEYDIISGIHIIKNNGKKGILNPHQDSTLIDESKASSYYIWMPLDGTDNLNGTLSLIPYSNRLEIPYRSLNIPWTLRKHVDLFWNYMIPIIIKKGQFVIFNSALIHGSSINKTPHTRIAVNSFIKPINEHQIHCYASELENFEHVYIYQIDPNFYYTQNILEKPNNNYTLLKKVHNTNKIYNKKEIIDILDIFANNYDKNIRNFY